MILIGGGAGGAGGTASAFNGGPGGGGGGGGEVHVNIPATLLPKDGEDFASIEITIGAGGARGTVGNPGTGGGDTVFGAGLLTAGGGQGGMTGTGTAPGVGGVGGAGMIPGGAGGSGRVSSGNGWPGGNSTSAYDLHGGGGGGGGGTDSGIGGPGGIGGISAGGTSGSSATRDGHPPSSIVATGAGGGAGGWSAYGFMGTPVTARFPAVLVAVAVVPPQPRMVVPALPRSCSSSSTWPDMGLVSHTIVFTADGLYYPPTGLRSLQVILRGAGGGAGKGGGGGGAAVATRKIGGTDLTRTGGVYDPVEVVVGAGGAGDDRCTWWRIVVRGSGVPWRRGWYRRWYGRRCGWVLGDAWRGRRIAGAPQRW